MVERYMLRFLGVCLVLVIMATVALLCVAVATAPENFDSDKITENDIPLLFGTGLPPSTILSTLVGSLAPSELFSFPEPSDFNDLKNSNNTTSKENKTKNNISKRKRPTRRPTRRRLAARRRRQLRRRRITKIRQIKKKAFTRCSRTTRVLRGLGGRLFKGLLFIV
uniref:Uncharacterized protein n=1 Tax=Pasiphaea japonica whispovirus TaxID=2984286 RepID=A0A9C7BRM7_9VIRU|nr:MAG: hypothetical protein [Pasiphaea japonica whispovirus]